MTIYDRILNKLYILLERYKGIDFSFIIPVHELGLDPTKVFHGSSSRSKELQNVLKILDIKAEDTILDIGCAKGGALYTMYNFPFKKIDGIEISGYLVTILKKNIKILNMNKTNIFNIDAKLFDYYNLYNYFYLYNPFDLETLNVVISLIIKKNNNFKIIYNNFRWPNLLINYGFKLLHDMQGRYGHRIRVYEYKC